MAQVAYDLSHFQREEKPPRPRVRVVKRQVSETRRQVGRMVRTLLAVTFLLGLVCAVLYTQTTLNELQRQIASTNKQLTEEDALYAHLTFQLENMTSLKNIEARAAELGMEKISNNQIVYFRVEEGDEIQVKGNPLDKLLSDAQGGFLDLMADIAPAWEQGAADEAAETDNNQNAG